MTRTEFAKLIDHSALQPETTANQIRQLCKEARTFGFGAVCVGPVWVPLAKETLTGSIVRIVTVIGFPHGNTLPAAKAEEARFAIIAGVHELDMVSQVGMLRSGDSARFLDDIKAVVNVARRSSTSHIIVKVILETALLTEGEKRLGCQLAEEAGADFVKTSTGFAMKGSTVEDVVLLRQVVGERLGVKAAGGIRDLTTALAMVEAGASRLGCSSSVSLIKEWPV